MSRGNLTRGLTQSCGCIRAERSWQKKHGMKGTQTYIVWKHMRMRCRNPNNADWPRYGGRGIKVCDRWNSFNNFLADMGERPPGMSIERIDVNGDYEPANCCWATMQEQARNKRCNSGVVHDGVWRTWAEWAERGAVSQQLLRSRVVVGRWPFAEALSTPPGKRKSPPRRTGSGL